MTNTVGTYTGLITSEHKDKQKFKKVVKANTKFYARLQQVLASIPGKFDLDTAVGDQLDKVGEWVGVKRNVPIPITGVYFEWDTADVGWEFGTWKADFDPVLGPSLLPDDSYRQFIKAKIAANKWNGSIPDAYEIYDSLFPEGGIVIQDNQDMTMVIGFFGTPPSAILKALLVCRFIALKPEGVRISYYAIVSNFAPLFGWDIDNNAINGWDTGDWPTEI
jgi:hypothetical protein